MLEMSNQASQSPLPATQDDLDALFSLKVIEIYEKIWGRGWMTPGGEASAKEFFPSLELVPGQEVLDIGSGLGGAAFYLARNYGVHVQGVDYSKNMVHLAQERLRQQESSISSKIKLSFGDILMMEYPKNTFDVIYSRDVFVLIQDKELLLGKIKDWLKPGGKLLIIDNCRGEGILSKEFLQYEIDTKKSLISMEEYGKILRDAGFDILNLLDITDKFLKQHQEDIKNIKDLRESIIQEFGESAYDNIIFRWTRKIQQCENKEKFWGYILAKK